MNQTEQQQHGLPVWLAVLRRRKIVIFLCTLAVPAAALALSLAQKKEYSASASLLFRDPQFDQKLFGSAVFATQTDPAREAATNIKLVSLEVAAARTAGALHNRLSPGQITSEVAVSPAG